MTLITDLPIWIDCPYRRSLPKVIEIRRGFALGRDTTVFVLGDFHLALDTYKTRISKRINNELAKLIIHSLFTANSTSKGHL